LYSYRALRCALKIYFGALFGKSLDESLDYLLGFAGEKTSPLSMGQLAQVVTSLTAEAGCLVLKDVPSIAGVDASAWRSRKWTQLRAQLLQHTRCLIFVDGPRVFVLTHNEDCEASLFSHLKTAVNTKAAVL
jgi:hypothetical protein